MKRILFAVEGMTPDKKALNYALTLCNPIRAGLDILQIMRPLGRAADFDKLKNRVRRTRDAFENAMVAATYAEAGAPELEGILEHEAMSKFKSLLPSDIDTAVDYHCIVTGEDPDAVVKRYVDEHRNIILAVYDTLRAGPKNAAEPATRNTMLSGLLSNLTIPLVLVRDMQA